jgi:hypothetical protein
MAKQPKWLHLPDIYHQVLACSASPEAAKDVISTARNSDKLELRGTKRVYRAPPNIKPKVVKLKPNQEPPKRPPKQPGPIEPETSYNQPLPKASFHSWDWYRGRATQRDGKDLVEWLDIVGRRDQALALAPEVVDRRPRPHDVTDTVWAVVLALDALERERSTGLLGLRRERDLLNMVREKLPGISVSVRTLDEAIAVRKRAQG